MSVAEVGLRELDRRFPRVVSDWTVIWDSAGDTCDVEVKIRANNGTNVSLREPLMDFPTANLIAQIALVV